MPFATSTRPIEETVGITPSGKTSRRTGTADRRWPPSMTRLKRLVDEAILDAYGEAEQRTGFLCALEEHLDLPFETSILGVTVTVEKVDVTEANEIVATCRRGRERQTIPILDLPLRAPRPIGAEWIEAYRRWARGN